MEKYLESHPEKKDSLKEKIFNFMSENLADLGEKTFALDSVAKIYPDTESILQIIDQTAGMDNSFNHLKILYKNILQQNSEPQVLDAVLERISNIKTIGRRDNGFDDILCRIMKEKADFTKIGLFVDIARDKDEIWIAAAEQFPSKETLSKILDQKEDVHNEALRRLLSQLKIEDIDENQVDKIIEKAINSDERNTLLQKLIEKDPPAELIDKILERITAKPAEAYQRAAAFFIDDYDEAPSKETKIDYIAQAMVFTQLFQMFLTRKF